MFSLEGISRGRLRASNLMWELLLGISTRGAAPEIGTEEYAPYATAPYAALHAILAHLKLRPDDVFVDLGCGKGRVVCCAARLAVREVIGVDMSSDLLTIAQANVRRLRGKRSSTRLVLAKAEEFNYPEVTAVYLFNPFGARTLSAVLSNFERATHERGTAIKVAYFNPVHESVLRQQSWLEEIDRWEPFHVFGQRNAVSFWRSRL